MRHTIVIENIEEMRRREGIDDVELREAIRGLRVGDFVRLRLQKRSDEYGYVAFTAFTLTGAPETLGRLRLVEALEGRITTFTKRLFNRGEGKIRLRQPIYQVQVVSESPLPLTPAQVRQLDELFLLARQNFAPPKLNIPAQ